MQSIGTIALDPNDAKTVWVGSGESWTRNSVSIGDGIYKSTDGGDTWTNMGLKISERIVKIIVDPKNSNTVYACVPGKLWSDSADRGLYKTSPTAARPGRWSSRARTCRPVAPRCRWTRKIHKCCSPHCGISAARAGPSVPAATMRPSRARAALFRSADGGKSWTEVTDKANKGFPAKPYGRIAVAVAPSNSKIVYAIVESSDSSLYPLR